MREKSVSIVARDGRLQLHLSVVESAMNLADALRQVDSEDEDLKVIKILAMRSFNAFASSIKLSLSGYSQNAVLLMRDILETVFLLDLFHTDWPAVRRWRLADDKNRWKEFSPVSVRKKLDDRDGFDGKRRDAHYKLFSQLAGHPTMQSPIMMRPKQDGAAVSGPFVEEAYLEAILSEMGRLAVCAGELIDVFFPDNWTEANADRAAFTQEKRQWIARFHTDSSSS